MSMNRKSFYASLRKRDSGVFGTSLSPKQVQATEAILDAGSHLPLPHLAHVLAEVYHETGGGMWPVKETVMPWHKDKNPHDATVINRLNVAWTKGQLSWVKAPYWNDGGFGRGMIQLTHLNPNYRNMSPIVGVDLVANPDKALEPDISAKIAVVGCERGMFTGKRLSDFDTAIGFDHYTARSIVNGDKNKVDGGVRMGDRIAGYAEAFEAALRDSGYRATQRPADAPPAPKADEVPKAENGLWAAVMGLLRTLGLVK